MEAYNWSVGRTESSHLSGIHSLILIFQSCRLVCIRFSTGPVRQRHSKKNKLWAAWFYVRIRFQSFYPLLWANMQGQQQYAAHWCMRLAFRAPVDPLIVWKQPCVNWSSAQVHDVQMQSISAVMTLLWSTLRLCQGRVCCRLEKVWLGIEMQTPTACRRARARTHTHQILAEHIHKGPCS